MTHTITILSGRLSMILPARAVAMIIALIAVVTGILFWSVMSGSYSLSSSEVIATLRGNSPSQMASTVVWEFRLPRTLTALFAGAFLAISGSILQYVTRNPLADPSLIGISQGAALAVVWGTIMLPSMSIYWQPLLALVGSFIVSSFILMLSVSNNGDDTLRFILMGLGIAAFISSITTALLTYGDIELTLEALGWLSGSIHSAGWDEVLWLSSTTLIALPCLIFVIRPISAIRFGPEVAIGLGVRVRQARWCLIALAVALAAIAVAAVGPLGFVGLIAPHLARRLARSGSGLHIIMTALTGATLVGIADFAGRVAFAPIQIPAGIITAVIGVPIFVFLILRVQLRGQF